MICKKFSLIICLIILLISAKNSSEQNWLPLDDGVGESLSRLYADTNNNLLYVTGIFSANSNNIFGGVAKWNGTVWDTLPNCQITPIKFIVFKYKDTLYLSGFFSNNPQIGSNIAKWNGNVFDTIPGTIDMNIYCTTEKNGLLFLGGVFNKCGNDSAFSLCTYNGHNFTAITPVYKEEAYILSMAFYHDTLYVGGVFNLYPGFPIASFAKWNGTGLVAVGDQFANVNCTIETMAVYKDELYIGGAFRKSDGFTGDYIMKWDGHQFTEVGGGANYRVTCMKVYNDVLYVGGWYTRIGNIDCDNIAKWDGTQWMCLNNDEFDFTNSIRDICVLNDRLYITGNFEKIGNDSIRNIAMFNHPLTSVTEYYKNSSQLSVYPNPVTGNEFTVSFPFIKTGTLQVVNLLGEALCSYEIRNTNKISINEASFKSGCYLLRVKSDSSIFTGKLVKQ